MTPKFSSDSPRISIITVCYNAEEVIGKTAKSISELSFRDFEYVVVDGASKDGTLAEVQAFEFPQLKVYSEPDHGIYDAMNKGLRLARGAFVWYLNAGDVVVDAGFLNHLDWADDFYYGGVIVSRKGEMVRRIMPSRLSWPIMSVFRQIACHQSMLVRKENTVQYDLKYRIVADYDWSIRILKQRGIRKKRIVSYWVEYDLEGFSARNPSLCWRERREVATAHFGPVAFPIIGLRWILDASKQRIKLWLRFENGD